MLTPQLPLIDVDVLAGFQDTHMEPLDVTEDQCGQRTSPGPKLKTHFGIGMRHIKKMKKRYSNKDKESALHFPRTLDHYFHGDLSRSQLQTLNEDQVLTRYLHQKSSEAVQTHTLQSPPSASPLSKDCTGWIGVGSRLGHRIRELSRTIFRTAFNSPQTGEASLEEGGKKSTGPRPSLMVSSTLGSENSTINIPENSRSALDLSISAHPILVVPQLWLVRIDSKCKQTRFLVFPGDVK